jgi:hypothetical protein
MKSARGDHSPCFRIAGTEVRFFGGKKAKIKKLTDIFGG